MCKVTNVLSFVEFGAGYPHACSVAVQQEGENSVEEINVDVMNVLATCTGAHEYSTSGSRNCDEAKKYL